MTPSRSPSRLDARVRGEHLLAYIPDAWTPPSPPKARRPPRAAHRRLHGADSSRRWRRRQLERILGAFVP
jgi:hypothetical protein